MYFATSHQINETSLYYCFLLRSIDRLFDWLIDCGLIVILIVDCGAWLITCKIKDWCKRWTLVCHSSTSICKIAPKHLVNRVFERHPMESYELDFFSPPQERHPPRTMRYKLADLGLIVIITLNCRLIIIRKNSCDVSPVRTSVPSHHHLGT